MGDVEPCFDDFVCSLCDTNEQCADYQGEMDGFASLNDPKFSTGLKYVSPLGNAFHNNGTNLITEQDIRCLWNGQWTPLSLPLAFQGTSI